MGKGLRPSSSTRWGELHRLPRMRGAPGHSLGTPSFLPEPGRHSGLAQYPVWNFERA